MSVYAFKFHVFENITKVGSSIGRTFSSMRTGAMGFTSAVNGSASAVGRLKNEGQQLGSLFSPLRNIAATIGVGAAVKEMTDYGDRIGTAGSLIAGITRNVRSLGSAQREALALSNQTGMGYADALDAVSKMLTMTNGDVMGAGRMAKMAAALAAINPAEGFEGALFALKELEGGDNMSLRERFNIRIPTGAEAKKIAEKDGRSIQQVMIGALQDYLDQSYGGGGEDGSGVEFLLKLRANSIGGQAQRIGNQLKNIFTPMLMPFLQRTGEWLGRTNAWLSENQATVRGIGSAFLEVLPRAAALYGIYLGFGAASSIWTVASAGMSIFNSGLYKAAFYGAWAVGNLRAMTIGAAQWAYQAVLSTGQAVRSMSLYVASLWAARPPLVTMQLMASVTWARVVAGFAAMRLSVLNYVGSLTLANIWQGMLTRIGAARAAVMTFAATAIPAMIGYASTLNFASIGQTLLNTLMLANPIGLIIAGVAALGAAFYGLFKLADYLFPGFFSGVKEWFGKAWDWIYNTLIAPLVKFFKWLGDITGISAAFSAGASLSGEQAAGLPTDEQNKSLFKSLGLDPNGEGKGLGKFGGNIGVGEKLDSVSGDRGGIKNYTINIGKQVESIVFQTTKDLGDIESKVRQVIERVMLDAVNDTNYAT